MRYYKFLKPEAIKHNRRQSHDTASPGQLQVFYLECLEKLSGNRLISSLLRQK